MSFPRKKKAQWLRVMAPVCWRAVVQSALLLYYPHYKNAKNRRAVVTLRINVVATDSYHLLALSVVLARRNN